MDEPPTVDDARDDLYLYKAVGNGATSLPLNWGNTQTTNKTTHWSGSGPLCTADSSNTAFPKTMTSEHQVGKPLLNVNVYRVSS